MIFLQRTLPLIIAFVVGMIGILTYYVPVWGDVEETFATWLRIIYAFAFLLGTYSLLHLHWNRIRRRNPGWGYSTMVYFGFGLTLVLAMYNNGGWFMQPQAEEGGLRWMFRYVQVPCQATMFSILAFFIASAAYRTFRARTPEAVILLVAAVLMMLGRVPIGAYIHEGLPTFAQWLMAIPNMAAKRGILLGVSLGGIATSLRIIFGIERSYLGGGDA
ncbi:MAG: hypothetical protein EXS64_04060 [Candidatus Latescibacteria bacterium]|nr:hypothetical protein [Candidatus Latescibacterota bacterium]